MPPTSGLAEIGGIFERGTNMGDMILNHEQVLKLLPDRDPESHKGDFGKLLLLCGSRGYTGAAALAAMGSLRCGAGLVYLAVPDCIYDIMAVKLTEPVVIPLPSKDGTFAVEAVEALRVLLYKMDAVLIGPGLSQSEGSLAVLTEVMTNFQGPVLVDADGLNLLATHKDLLRRRKAVTVLTPHEGEFARLAPDLYGDRMHRAKTFAREYACIVVLKGHKTLIADPDDCYINTTGNPGMAVGGSGDVLAGMIISLIGQGLDPLQASAAGVWLHGSAGDLSAVRLGQYGMLPTDLLEDLPRLMK